MATHVESTPEEMITSDFTINTYKVEVLSVQYVRLNTTATPGPIQVPFALSLRGPETLRGRTLEVVSTELGKEQIK